MKSYLFIKEPAGWFVDLPDFIEQGGSKGDLQMVEGADRMLDIMSGQSDSVSVIVSREQFEGADLLTLVEICDPYIGGGYYKMEKYNGEIINITMWLCAVTEYVFDELPQQIFVKKSIPTLTKNSLNPD